MINIKTNLLLLGSADSWWQLGGSAEDQQKKFMRLAKWPLMVDGEYD